MAYVVESNETTRSAWLAESRKLQNLQARQKRRPALLVEEWRLDDIVERTTCNTTFQVAGGFFVSGVDPRLNAFTSPEDILKEYLCLDFKVQREMDGTLASRRASDVFMKCAYALHPDMRKRPSQELETMCRNLEEGGRAFFEPSQDPLDWNQYGEDEGYSFVFLYFRPHDDFEHEMVAMERKEERECQRETPTGRVVEYRRRRAERLAQRQAQMERLNELDKKDMDELAAERQEWDEVRLSKKRAATERYLHKVDVAILRERGLITDEQYQACLPDEKQRRRCDTIAQSLRNKGKMKTQVEMVKEREKIFLHRELTAEVARALSCAVHSELGADAITSNKFRQMMMSKALTPGGLKAWTAEATDDSAEVQEQ